MSTKDTPESIDNIDSLSFEASINELEALVAALEKGDLSLEASLSTFEQGVRLTKACQQHLSQAEQKIKLLTESGDTVTFAADAN